MKAAIPTRLLREALYCVAVRARWYETRGYRVPRDTMDTLRHLADLLGVNPTEVGPP
jgi:hypothetical protein